MHLPEIDGARSIWYIERQLVVAVGVGEEREVTSDGEEHRRKRMLAGSTSNRIKGARGD